DSRHYRFGQTVIERVSRDANNLNPAVASRSGYAVWRLTDQLRHPYRVAEHFFAGEVASGKGLVDHGESRAARDLRLIPQAASKQWNAENTEIFWTHEVDSRVLIFGRAFTKNVEGLGPAVVWRRSVGGNTGGYAGHSCDAFEQLAEVGCALGPGVA